MNTGKRYLDACGGLRVLPLGHDTRTVSPPSRRKVDTLAFAHTGAFTKPNLPRPRPIS